MKKTYMQPEVKWANAEIEELLVTSPLNPDGETTSTTPDDEVYDGEFTSNSVNVWDE